MGPDGNSCKWLIGKENLLNNRWQHTTAALRAGTRGDENGDEKRDSGRAEGGDIDRNHCGATSPSGNLVRTRFWEQEIEAPAARWEARKGKSVFFLASFAPYGRR